ncbi:MAG: MATE family efflux transporter, partial [Acidobacteriota bacterium]|nr:MATE family efflux transporter [Acidobacteriota bacterium]
FRRYLQASGLATQVTAALITANAINAGANWLLVFGNLGLPALGVDGAGWATCISRLYMALGLGVLIFRYHRRQRTPLLRVSFKPDLDRMRRLVNLGLPASLQTTLEVGVFAAVTSLAGKLEPAAVAAHQIALNAAGFVFMVPLGVSSAGAVRVGREIGRGDPQRAADSGWMALLLGSGFMLLSGLLFVLLPEGIMRLFTVDAQVIAIGTPLLLIAAAFMFFDGIQVVATGNLRGAADTRTPMVVNLIGHWPFGMVLGYWLCFHLNWGVQGLWVGLSAGLIGIGAVLLGVWTRKSRELSEGRTTSLQ